MEYRTNSYTLQINHDLLLIQREESSMKTGRVRKPLFDLI